MGFNYLDTVLPSGVSAASLICVYQFDGPTNGFTDRSGNGYDLAHMGGGNPYYTKGRQGEGLWMNYRLNDYAQTGAQTGVFNTLGALTVEWIGSKLAYGNSAEFLFAIGNVPSSTESVNCICSLYKTSWGNPQGWRAFHERGAGVDVLSQFEWIMLPFGLEHGVLTRASDGVTYKLYSDGELLETVVASDPPTGGTGAIRIYLFGTGSSSHDSYGYLNSFRYCKDVEFTPAQVLESYNRVHV
jgi:hypothetical protein